MPFLLYAGGENLNTQKSLVLKKISTPITIDGIIDDAWSQADSATNFFQLQPYYANKPTKHSYAKVLTSESSLYCLIVSYDEIENIQKFTGKQDEGGNGDIVSIMLDTFGDKRTAYKFAVTAAGVRADCRLLDDARQRDYNWDGVWFSDAKIYDWGYVVEMEIPYKSLQYDETLNSWGLDFDRWRPINSEDLYWCQYQENEGQRISKFGQLVFQDFKPSIKGMNLELYPVAFGKMTYIGNNKYKVDPNAGLDIFYNPSPQLTLQATANPDFAQIEADPYNFNISRYESYFSERRPFFTQGNEIFMAAGKQRNSGFYSPLELFYSRRIGKKLPDGSEVPITFGAKAFGRLDDFEYGGFVARTAETDYSANGKLVTEPSALFGSARLKKQIFGNSTIGVLFVGKQSNSNTYGVIDIDGAFRDSDWQLSYQLARSIKNSEGDFAASVGFMKFSEKFVIMSRNRYVGEKFDIDQVGYVPWRGTINTLTLVGPRWYFEDGYVREILLFLGGGLTYEKVDEYTDRFGIIGMDMNFRDNWGFEIVIDGGKSKDLNVNYNSYETTFSTWINISPKWNANMNGGYTKTYNFSRQYVAGYSWLGGSASYKIAPILSLGTSFSMYTEFDPQGDIEEITYNARPYFSLTPLNDLNIRMYVDNLYIRSTKKLERMIIGFLFAYQFSPKSWIYFALNENHDRNNLVRDFEMRDRVGVFKIKYLYYL